MKRIPLLALLCVAAMAGGIPIIADDAANGISVKKTSVMKIRIKLERTTLTATLTDSATSVDFVSLLPLTLTLKDYAATEKISDLPRRLSTSGAPAGSDPAVGDIAYYAPWGNLALFYNDFGYSEGLIKLGKINGDVEALKRAGDLKVTIELVR